MSSDKHIHPQHLTLEEWQGLITAMGGIATVIEYLPEDPFEKPDSLRPQLRIGFRTGHHLETPELWELHIHRDGFTTSALNGPEDDSRWMGMANLFQATVKRMHPELSFIQ